MKKPHPITAIALGLLTVSLLFNYLQSQENQKLRKRLDQSGGMPIIIDVPNLYQDDIPKPKKDII
jgi:hypothetical protein